MSLRVLVDDQIEKLFNDSPELRNVKKNEFEIAVASFVNVKYLNGIEFDDLIDGIMGEGGDEGIDLCYIFHNGVLVKDEQIDINKESNIRVKFFQVKKENSFSTNGFRAFKEGIEEIFNLDLELTDLKRIGANDDIIEMATLIRNVFRKSRAQRAKFFCEVFYVTTSPELNISMKIQHLADQLKENVLKIPFEFDFLGAQKLLDLTDKEEETLEIVFDSQPLNISEKDVETMGFAGFVKGNELIKSLLDNNNEFRSHLTEGNIRFFLGEDKLINSSIIDSALEITKASNFWAMNNGLTIIGDSISSLGTKNYSVINPQIVNGCQTVHCLYHAYNSIENSKKLGLPENLKVFIKLIKTDNLDTQTDIISATNSQNPVKSASLKANDLIQKNIQRFLQPVGIYYERRDNFYKRQGFTGNKVIGLLKMAQIVHTVVNKESIIAANDTTTLFDSTTKYESIFDEGTDFDIYKFSTMLYQRIWSLKNSDIRTNQYDVEIRDLISKGGFVFLHIVSSLLMSKATFKEKSDIKNQIIVNPFSIKVPLRKNEFTKRKEWLFNKIEDDDSLSKFYEESKNILFEAAENYSSRTHKSKNSLFKYRSFDKDFLIPVIEKYLRAQELESFNLS